MDVVLLSHFVGWSEPIRSNSYCLEKESRGTNALDFNALDSLSSYSSVDEI